jgi:EmrB/QacA subfamily drug resistance transporter
VTGTSPAQPSLTSAGAEPAPTGSAEPSGSEPVVGSGRWLILAVVCLAQLMVVLDATVVNIALPSAQTALHFGNDDRQWVVTSYSLAFGGLLLLGGRLSDMFGRGRVLIFGMVGFAAASALAGAATGFETLVAGRALQGAFGALLAPAALSTLTTTFTDVRERGKAFGLFGAIAGAGGAVGLLLGGVLTEYLDWRWTLYVNVAFAVVAVPIAFKLLPKSHRNHDVHLDLPGTVLVSGGLVAVVWGFSQAETGSWGSIETIVLLVLGVLLLAGFVVTERRVAHPLLPLRVVLDRFRGGAYLAVGFSAMGLFAVFLFLTYYLQLVKGFSPVASGAAFLPMIVSLIAVSTIGSSLLATRVGPRVLVPLGLIVGAGGMVYLASQLAPGSRYATTVLPGLIIVGCGLGLVFSSAINTATSGTQPSDAGVASAMVNTCQQVGGAIGTALLNTIAASALSGYLSDHGSGSTAQISGAVHSYSIAFWCSAGIFAATAAIAAIVLPWGLVSGRSEPQPSA